MGRHGAAHQTSRPLIRPPAATGPHPAGGRFFLALEFATIEPMSIVLYELTGAEGRCFSPYCWRALMALAHKGLEFERRPIRFSDKAEIAFSGQDRVPVLADGERVVPDSWDIACHLEDNYPEAPSLFGGDQGRALARFVAEWTASVQGQILTSVVLDIYNHLDPADHAYFRESREKRLGASLEEVQEGREQRLPALLQALQPLRSTLGTQLYLCGQAPAYADYVIFGSFQWARVISPFKLLEPDDPVHAWRQRLLDLYDGLAGQAPGYAV